MTSLAWTAVRLAVTVAILAWVARDLDSRAAAAALARFTSAGLLLALALLAVDRALMYIRWRLLIRPFTSLSERDLVRIFFVSAFVGSFLPAGVGGDAARAFSVSREGGNSGAAVASVVVDRWLGLLAVALSGCAGFLVAPSGAGGQLSVLSAAIALVLLCGVVAGLNAERVVERLLPSSLKPSWPGRLLLRLGSAVAAYRQYPGTLARVGGLSVAVQANRIVLAWVIGASLGIALPFRYYWLFMPLNILVILIPVSLGGFGLPQGAMVWSLGPFGVAPTEAFLLSTLFVGAGVLGNLPGALMFTAGRSRPGGDVPGAGRS